MPGPLRQCLWCRHVAGALRGGRGGSSFLMPTRAELLCDSKAVRSNAAQLWQVPPLAWKRLLSSQLGEASGEVSVNFCTGTNF